MPSSLMIFSSMCMMQPCKEEKEGSDIFESISLANAKQTNNDIFTLPHVIPEYDGTQQPKDAQPQPRKDSNLDKSWFHFEQSGYNFGTETELASSSSSSGSKSKESLIPLYEKISKVNIPENITN